MSTRNRRMKRKPAFSAFELRPNAKKRKLRRSKSGSQLSRLLLLKPSASNRKGSPLKKLPPKLIVLSKRELLPKMLLAWRLRRTPKMSESVLKRRLPPPKLSEFVLKRRPESSKRELPQKMKPRHWRLNKSDSLPKMPLAWRLRRKPPRQNNIGSWSKLSLCAAKSMHISCTSRLK